MPKAIIYNDDGWSNMMRYPAPMSPKDIVRITVGPVVGTAVKVYQFCALGGHVVNYNSTFLSRVGEMVNRVDTMRVWRMRDTLRHLEQLGTDPLRIVSEACHQHGIDLDFTRFKPWFGSGQERAVMPRYSAQNGPVVSG